MSGVLTLAFLAALNPTLLTATTVMLLLPSPKRLMLGYYAGAMLTSITIGTLIVFSLDSSTAVTTTKNSLSPAAKIAMGALALVIAWALRSGRAAAVAERRRARAKGEPRWQQALGKGSARVTFAVGAMLTLPGASYLIGLHRIHNLDTSDAGKLVAIVAFNLIMMGLLEAAMLSFVFAPEWTPRAIDRGKVWIRRHGRRVAVQALVVIGVLQILRGVLELVT